MPDAASSPPIGPGHNRPPEPIVDMVTSDPKVLQTRLDRQYAEIKSRFVELELGAGKVPARITTDAEAKTVIDWIAQQCRALTNQASTAHTTEKKPYLEGGRIVDQFFLGRIKHFADVIGPIERRIKRYHDQKKTEQRAREDADRRRAQAQRDQAAADAARLTAAAQQREAAGDRRGAIELTQQAQQHEDTAALAAAQAAAPPAPTHLHGDYGATAFAREDWDFEVIDPAAVPLGYLTIDEAAVREAIKEGVREIAGLRIFPFDRFTIRRC